MTKINSAIEDREGVRVIRLELFIPLAKVGEVFNTIKIEDFSALKKTFTSMGEGGWLRKRLGHKQERTAEDIILTPFLEAFFNETIPVSGGEYDTEAMATIRDCIQRGLQKQLDNSTAPLYFALLDYLRLKAEEHQSKTTTK